MKKYVIQMFVLITIIYLPKVYAGNVTISANKTSVKVSSKVTISINITNLSGRFKVVSSNPAVLAGGESGWCDNNICENGMSTTIIFDALTPGTSVVSVVPIDVSDNTGDGYEFTETRSIPITVIEKSASSQIDVNKTYSKNNYLKSLSVDGYELTPAFDKDTLEYSVELNPGTESVNIVAVKEDESASIKGTGETSVSEGINTVEVTVTAENGNERIYIIKMNVEEKDPIDVKVNGKNYRVVKKKELIEKIDNYEEVDVNINNITVPGLYNDVTKVTLIGLKDSDGNIKYFSYNSGTGEYKEYNEFKFDVMNLYITEPKKSKYEKTKLTINEIEVPAYKVDGVDDYYLIYATNTSTGYKGYYLYDKKENSVQRYDSKLLDKTMQEKDKYFNVVLVLSCVCFLSMLFLLIEVNRENKREV